MDISKVIEPKAIRLLSTAGNSDEILGIIARLTAHAALSGNVDTVLDALNERERIGSTSCGHGIAIPHCRIPSLTEFVVGLVILDNGIDFDAVDNEVVDLFPFVVGPEDKPKKHLKILSTITGALRDEDFRAHLRNAKDTDEIIQLFEEKTHIPQEVPEKTSGNKLIHVFIQNEDIFDDVLQVFASMDDTYAMVMDADESTRYLKDIPFYAGFWNTDTQDFNRIIMAVVRDELVNAALRNIEFSCGALSKRNDIMVTVSDLHRVLGSLDF